MRSRRIHVFGASGAGVTRLGRALAEHLGLPHHDTDDYYWQPTVPPYTVARPAVERLRLMREMFLDRGEWVLSGSLDGWGDPLIGYFDLALFVYTPTAIRLERIREREARRFGAEAVAPGGSREASLREFIEWASHYDDGSREGRKLARHEAWIARLPCPVLRLDGSVATGRLVDQAASSLP